MFLPLNIDLSIKNIFINSFILFFTITIIYTFLYSNNQNYNENYILMEGIDNKESNYNNYSDNDPVVLSKKNAGNIEYLKGQVDDLIKIKNTVIDMKITVDKLNQQVSAITQQQQIYSQKITNQETPKP